MSVATSIVESQLTDLRKVYPGAAVVELPDGSALVTVPGVAMPSGWNQSRTTVAFLAPTGYPMARPDCFWADTALRLASGNVPGNANIQPLPGSGEQRLWFSWHLAQWDAHRDSLLTYVRVIQGRFARAQ